jgi:spore coat polysaccharide biosynthesis protein SpsF
MRDPLIGKITAIIQARMSSKRFPGKTLHPVAGKPLLQYLLERLARCERLGQWVVATSTDSSDDAIAQFCREKSVPCFRGSLENVAERILKAVEHQDLEAFVRVNGDSPLLDPALIDKAIQFFFSGDYDLVTNVMERTYPRGQSVEVARVKAFRKAYALAQSPEELEHVTQAFYTNASSFKILNIRAERSYEGLRLVVDTPEDMAAFTRIIARMDRPHWLYGLDQIVTLYRELEPEAKRV